MAKEKKDNKSQIKAVQMLNGDTINYIEDEESIKMVNAEDDGDGQMFYIENGEKMYS